MEQSEKRKFLIEYLLSERNLKAEIPADSYGQKRLWRALVNEHAPKTASPKFLRVQDEYLFHFPNERAAQIAVNTVAEYKAQTQSKIKVIFNVFKECDYAIYAKLLGADK